MYYLHKRARSLVFAARSYNAAIYDLTKSRPNFDIAVSNPKSALENLVSEIVRDGKAQELVDLLGQDDLNQVDDSQRFADFETRQLCNLLPASENKADDLIVWGLGQDIKIDKPLSDIDVDALISIIKNNHNRLVGAMSELRFQQDIDRKEKKQRKKDYKTRSTSNRIWTLVDDGEFFFYCFQSVRNSERCSWFWTCDQRSH